MNQNMLSLSIRYCCCLSVSRGIVNLLVRAVPVILEFLRVSFDRKIEGNRRKSKEIEEIFEFHAQGWKVNYILWFLHSYEHQVIQSHPWNGHKDLTRRFCGILISSHRRKSKEIEGKPKEIEGNRRKSKEIRTVAEGTSVRHPDFKPRLRPSTCRLE